VETSEIRPVYPFAEGLTQAEVLVRYIYDYMPTIFFYYDTFLLIPYKLGYISHVMERLQARSNKLDFGGFHGEDLVAVRWINIHAN